VLAGAGVAVLPRYFVADDLAAGRLVEPLAGQRLRSDRFRLIWREGHPAAAALRALADELAALPLR
jgi:LysR family glycine cleavage system transcriptional activator